MKKRKFVCAVLAFLTAAGLSGCGRAQSDEIVYKIGILISNTENESMLRYAEALSERFEEMNTSEKRYELTVLNSDSSSAKQVMQTKTFAYQQYDALIVSLTDGKNAENIIENSVSVFEAAASDEGETPAGENDGEVGDDAPKSDEQQNDEDGISAEEIDTEESYSLSEERENVAAEPDPRADGVDVPNMESRSIPVVFTFTEPVIEPNEGEEANDATGIEGDEAGGAAEKKEDKISLDNWCAVVTKDADGGVLLGKAAENLPGKGDINSDGVFNYMVAANSKKDNTYTKYTETLAGYFSEKGIEANCLEEFFSESKNSSFEKNLRNIIDANWERADAVFCLDERTAEALYALTNEGREASVEQNGESEGESKPELKYYDIGTDFYVVGITSVEGGKKLLAENKLSAAVSFDVSEVAKKAAEAAANYLDGIDNLKLQSVDAYSEVKKNGDE